jgi:hypothetical protein
MRLRRTTTAGSELDGNSPSMGLDMDLYKHTTYTQRYSVMAHRVPALTGATNECPIVRDVWFDLRVGPGYRASGFDPNGPAFG